MSEYKVDSSATDKEWVVENKVRDHEILASEPGAGGQDAGPNPVELLTSAVNSCLTISEEMIVKVHNMDVKNFKIENHAFTRKLEHGKSEVYKMELTISFDSEMSDKEKERFVGKILHVSTVYQTVAKAVEMEVKTKF